MGTIGLLAAVLVHREMPDLPVPSGAGALRELGALKRKQVWLMLGIGAIVFGGLFAVFRYIKPLLIDITGVAEPGCRASSRCSAWAW